MAAIAYQTELKTPSGEVNQDETDIATELLNTKRFEVPRTLLQNQQTTQSKHVLGKLMLPYEHHCRVWHSVFRERAAKTSTGVK